MIIEDIFQYNGINVEKIELVKGRTLTDIKVFLEDKEVCFLDLKDVDRELKQRGYLIESIELEKGKLVVWLAEV